MAPVKSIPERYQSVVPQLRFQNPERLIDFLEKAFSAKETERFTMPDGSIVYAEVRLGDSVMLSGALDENYKPTYNEFHLYVEDCNLLINKL